MARDASNLIFAAWLTALAATLGSLRYSGIGFLGIGGLGMPPCEMCWYQRILMYPLAGLLGVAYVRRDLAFARVGIFFAAPGAVLAAYHSLIQWRPDLEGGECIVGACSSIQYKALGLSIPNQSLLAFLLIAGLLGAALKLTPAPPLPPEP